MTKELIVHISEVEPSEAGGMGRVIIHWREAFERAGYEFVHIGPKAVGTLPHQALFPYAAYLKARPYFVHRPMLVVHEPSSGPFAFSGLSYVVESHGIERRAWKLGLRGKMGEAPPSGRTKVVFPLWRLLPAEVGLRRASGILCSNREDLGFLETRLGRLSGRAFVFRNGVTPSLIDETNLPDEGQDTVLFMGSWISRKGIRVLVEAAKRLFDRGVRPRWLLTATIFPPETVLRDWPSEMHSQVEVISAFSRESEDAIFSRGSVFVLPSFFEGQALSLLQALETGRCCIASANCAQRDLIRDQENGLLFPTGSSVALENCLDVALRDRSLRKALGQKAKRNMNTRTWKIVGQEVVDFVSDVCKREARTR